MRIVGGRLRGLTLAEVGAGDAAARDEALARLAAADAAGRLDGAEERMIALLAIGDAGAAAARR